LYNQFQTFELPIIPPQIIHFPSKMLSMLIPLDPWMIFLKFQRNLIQTLKKVTSHLIKFKKALY